MQTINFRRRDGAIDYSRYTREARRLRAEAKARVAKRAARLARAAFGAAVSRAAIVLASVLWPPAAAANGPKAGGRAGRR